MAGNRQGLSHAPGDIGMLCGHRTENASHPGNVAVRGIDPREHGAAGSAACGGSAPAAGVAACPGGCGPAHTLVLADPIVRGVMQTFLSAKATTALSLRRTLGRTKSGNVLADRNVC